MSKISELMVIVKDQSIMIQKLINKVNSIESMLKDSNKFMQSESTIPKSSCVSKTNTNDVQLVTASLPTNVARVQVPTKIQTRAQSKRRDNETKKGSPEDSVKLKMQLLLSRKLKQLLSRRRTGQLLFENAELSFEEIMGGQRDDTSLTDYASFKEGTACSSVSCQATVLDDEKNRNSLAYRQQDSGSIREQKRRYEIAGPTSLDARAHGVCRQIQYLTNCTVPTWSLQWHRRPPISQNTGSRVALGQRSNNADLQSMGQARDQPIRIKRISSCSKEHIARLQRLLLKTALLLLTSGQQVHDLTLLRYSTDGFNKNEAYITFWHLATRSTLPTISNQDGGFRRETYRRLTWSTAFVN